MKTCKRCKWIGYGQFCGKCGTQMPPDRITLSALPVDETDDPPVPDLEHALAVIAAQEPGPSSDVDGSVHQADEQTDGEGAEPSDLTVDPDETNLRPIWEGSGPPPAGYRPRPRRPIRLPSIRVRPILIALGSVVGIGALVVGVGVLIRTQAEEMGEDDNDDVLLDVAPEVAAVNATSRIADDEEDACGNTGGYGPDRVSDGRPSTAWKARGDASGERLTLSLAGSSRLGRVGLVPGFNEIESCTGINRFDDYRRIERVKWEFDDGTSVEQSFTDSPSPQYIQLDPAVKTERVVVTVLSTRSPGDITYNYTTISEIILN